MLAPRSARRALCAVLPLLTVAASPAGARPEYLELWRERYPASTLPGRLERQAGSPCRLCHDPLPPGRTAYRHDDAGNCYRETLHVLRHEAGGPPDFAAALPVTEALDSDADGVPNLLEILWPRPDGEVGYHPGVAGPFGRDRCGERGDEAITGVSETPPVAPGLDAVPQVLAYGDVGPGESGGRTFAVRNLGAEPRAVTGVSIGRGVHVGYSVYSLDPLPRLLKPGEESRFLASYVPASPGYFYQMLAWPEVSTDDPRGATITVLLRSTGGSGLKLPETLDFGVTGASGVAERLFRIENPGPSSLRVTAARWEAGGGAFRLASGLEGATVTPGGVLEAHVAFAPGGEGLSEDRLAIECNGPFVPEQSVRVRAEARWPFTRGDANFDGVRDVSDGVAILRVLFTGASAHCREALDADAGGAVDLSDAIFLLGVLFVGQGSLAAPCTVDTAPGYLGCQGGPGDCG